MEEMVHDAVAELIVGFAPDPVGGGHLVIGAGGGQPGNGGWRTILLLPFTEQEATEAIEGLKINGLLQGYRGKPAALGAHHCALMAVQTQVMAGNVLELVIVPLWSHPRVLAATDALLV